MEGSAPGIRRAGGRHESGDIVAIAARLFAIVQRIYALKSAIGMLVSTSPTREAAISRFA